MGFFDFLFGEGPSTDTQVLDTLTPEQQASLNQLLKDLGGASPTFGGEAGIEASELQNLSLQALEERAIALGDPNRENALASGAADTLLKFLDFENQDAEIEDFFNTNIRDPALKDFQENVLPQISRSFGGANFFSSERTRTDQNAQEEIIGSLTRSRSDLEFQDRNLTRDRALQALGLAGEVDALGRRDTDELMALFGIGQEQTGLDERNFERAFDVFLANEGVASNRRSQLLGGVGTQAFENVVTSNPGSSGFIVDLLAAATGGGVNINAPDTKIGGEGKSKTSTGSSRAGGR